MNEDKGGKMGSRKKRTVGGQLVLMLIIASVTMMGLVLLVLNSAKRIMVRQYGAGAEQSVRAVSENLDYTLQDVENISKSILFNHELMNELKEGKKEEFLLSLTSYYNSNSNIERISIVYKEEIWHVGTNMENPRERFPEEILEGTSGEIIWTEARPVYIQILSGKVPRNYFSMARKMVDIISLEELGMMSIEIDERILQETCSGLKEEGALIYIMDREGRSVSSLEEVGEDFNIVYLKLGKELTEIEEGVIEYKIGGEERVAIYCSFNQGRWILMKTIPKLALYKEINKVQKNVLAGSVAVFLFMLGAGLAYSKKITKPISNIMRQMEEVKKGCLNVRVDTKSDNELGDLGESFNQMITRIQELMEEVVIAERNKNELELEVLHAQINPHFLYNTLNTIRWMAKIKGEDSISSALVALVKLLRISISLGKNLILLEEELQYIENYIQIQRLRFDQDFQIEYQIQKADKESLIPKLILQPIVENAIIYGMEGKKGEGEVLRIQVYTKDWEEGIKITVEDNGPGIEPEVIEHIIKKVDTIQKFSKVGLNNVNQRVKMYFGKEYGLYIESLPKKGTKVSIQIPRKTEQD